MLLKLLYDLETTGLNTRECHVTEIAALNDFAPSEQFNVLVHTKEIPEFIQRMNGITPEMLADQPSIAVQMEQFTQYIHAQHVQFAELQSKPCEEIRVVLVAHNGHVFDNRIMKRLVAQVLSVESQAKWARWHFGDTLGPLRKSHPEHKSNSLDKLADIYCKAGDPDVNDSIPVIKTQSDALIRHRAMFDVLLMRRMWSNLPHHELAEQAFLEYIKTFDELQLVGEPKKKRKVVESALISVSESEPKAICLEPLPEEEQPVGVSETPPKENGVAWMKSRLQLMLENAKADYERVTEAHAFNIALLSGMIAELSNFSFRAQSNTLHFTSDNGGVPNTSFPL